MGSVISPRVHDLIRIDAAIAADWEAPAWVAPTLARAPWVVVRRARIAGGVPIGVRGALRRQRFATHIEAAAICELLAPAELIVRIATGARRLEPAARAVDAAARQLRIRWAPVGAYGFELASRTPATHAASDLDIVIWGNPPLGALAEFAARCTQIERATGVRIDADVLFEDAGVALGEFVSGSGVVLAKTPAGPVLMAKPA